MKVVFAAGGTGGHFNTALAAAGGWRRREPDSDVPGLGTGAHMGSRPVPAGGCEF